MSEFKNDIAWSRIFEELHILNQVKTDGAATVSAKQIKEIGHREPRLIAKFDHRNQQPKLFVDNDLSIIATSRNDYLIGRFDLFQSLADDADYESRTYSPVAWLESADYPNFTSEALTINYAFSAGIIADLLGISDPTLLKPTRAGRGTTGKWTFQFTVNGTKRLVRVDNAQIEIEAMYETPDALAIFEVKQGAPDDFNRRQLFYPWRTWQAKLPGKPIRLFYADYLEGTYRFFEYRFRDPNDIGSMELVGQTQYVNADGAITTDDLQELLRDPLGHDSDNRAPFPQADNFEKVLALLNALENGPMTKEEIADRVVGNADNRQGDYYGNALRYLGLAEKSGYGDISFAVP